MPTFIAFVVVLALGVLGVAWTRRRSRGILDSWAASSGYTVLEAERRYLRRGPFFLRSANSQEVFRVALRDESGATRWGFVRVGSWWLGLFSENVAVEWD